MYLVIEYQEKNYLTNEVVKYTTFIDLSKDQVEKDIKQFFEKIKQDSDLECTKVYYSRTIMTNW